MLRVVVLWACVAASLAAPPVGRVTADAAASVRDADALGARRQATRRACTAVGTITCATAQDNFKKWNDALQSCRTKDVKVAAEEIAALYSEEKDPKDNLPILSFLPTVSPNHIKDKKKDGVEDTTDYFVDFCGKNPAGEITDDIVMQLGGTDAYLHSGLYTFQLGDLGAQSPVKARFSYVWKKYGNDWKITHHHSSLAPIAARRSGEAAAELTADDTAAEETAALVAKAAEAAPSPTSRRLLTTPEDAATNFKKWVDALKTKNADTVAALYSTAPGELSFLPTVEPKHLKTNAEAKDYFVKFVKNNPYGIITDEQVQAFGTDAYLHSGLYTFALGETMGKQTMNAARFSYVWKKYGNDWKIIHHHSSKQPTGIISAADLKKVGKKNFKAWNDALATKDPKKVAAMYIKEGEGELSFLPTVSPSHVKKMPEVEDYFKEFVKKNPAGTITDEVFQMFDSGGTTLTALGGDGQPGAVPTRVLAYLHTGMYTFELDQPGGRSPVSARFSYMWKKVGEDWKITHHHSSVQPSSTAAATSTYGMQTYISRLAIAAVAMAALAAVAALAAAAKAFSNKAPSITIPPAPAPAPPPLSAPVPNFVSSDIQRMYSQPMATPVSSFGFPQQTGFPQPTQEPFVQFGAQGPISVSSRY